MTNEAERFHIGATIAGRYRVECAIGEGAMGMVARARHVSLDETVAIKFLQPELRRDPVAIARLSREAKALARIKSDHVARVMDVGVTLAFGPYMVMEHLEGVDLGEVLSVEGPLSVERVVEIVMQVCEALTVAHTAGVVHRDIKPQNLFLARHGQFETLKLLDFGISEDQPSSVASERPPQPLSGEGVEATPLYGTPTYMSPERIRNDPAADHRSDIWSIGVVLHELVTGRALFDAPTVTETCARVVSDAPLELDSNGALLPPRLRSIVERCLERDPSRRYQSVEELAAALAPLGTMAERFRGRSTGAFTRRFVEEQLAASHTQRLQLPVPTTAAPTPVELSSALRDIGAALRWVARALPFARVYDRPLWQYAAVALGSALVALVVASRGGDFAWVSPPSAAIRAEPLEPGERHAVRGFDEAPAVPPSLADASPRSELRESGIGRRAADDEREPAADAPVALTPESGTPESAALEDNAEPAAAPTGARASRAHRSRARSSAARAAARRKRAAAELPLVPKEAPEEPSLAARPRLVPERPSPIGDERRLERAERRAKTKRARKASPDLLEPTRSE